MTKPTGRELQRLRKAYGWSRAGLVGAFRTQAAFRLEVALSILLLPAAFVLGRSIAEILLLIGAVVLVLVVELVNTAIECVVDRIGPEYHTLSKLAKDAGSAAVLLSALYGGLVWALILAARLQLI